MLRRAALLSSGLTSAGVENGIIQDDWDTINEICKSGRASEFYSVGDGKVVSLEEIGEVTFRLAGFKADIKADRTGVAETSWLVDYALRSGISDTAYQSSLTSSLPKNTYFIQRVLSIHYKMESLFPSELYDVIVSIKKPYVWAWKNQSGSSSKNYTSYIDSKIWWATGVELFSSTYGTCLYEGFIESIGGKMPVPPVTPPKIGYETKDLNDLVSRSYYIDTRGNVFDPSTTVEGNEVYGTGGNYVLGFCL